MSFAKYINNQIDILQAFVAVGLNLLERARCRTSPGSFFDAAALVFAALRSSSADGFF